MVRTIAFYLPQFHPIPENDMWWGKGFTEWTNTAKAKPLFEGHYQPHIPADLGFYDLRVPETRAAQAELASRYGIHGFCYYHYWFGDGRRVLERPFNEVLSSGQPDLPFCLCWVNQSWTGIWYGAANRLLIEQKYPGEEDARKHFEFLLNAFQDRRYIRVNSRPLLLIFSPEELPNSSAFLRFWRSLAKENGFPEMFILGVRHMLSNWNPHNAGFDGAVDMRIPLRSHAWRPDLGKGIMIDHSTISHLEVAQPQDGVQHFPCIGPSWDNTPRLGQRGIIYINSSPDLFKSVVMRAVDFLKNKPDAHKLLFVKAWNEWAEGNHLEPDLRFGHDWLKALQDGTRSQIDPTEKLTGRTIERVYVDEGP